MPMFQLECEVEGVETEVWLPFLIISHVAALGGLTAYWCHWFFHCFRATNQDSYIRSTSFFWKLGKYICSINMLEHHLCRANEKRKKEKKKKEKLGGLWNDGTLEIRPSSKMDFMLLKSSAPCVHQTLLGFAFLLRDWWNLSSQLSPSQDNCHYSAA